MTSADLKLDIFRKIDSLDNRKIKTLYGDLINLINSNNSFEEWEILTENERQGLINAEEQFKNGQYKDHETVMKKFRKIINGK